MIQGSKRKFCSDRCFDAYKRVVDIPRLAKAGVAKLAFLRSEGVDPSHGGEAGQKRGKSNAYRATQRGEWEKLGLDIDAEKERFVREILPGLRAVTILQIVKATEFSRHYASLVRRGLYVPHPVHYKALSSLVDTPGRQRA